MKFLIVTAQSARYGKKTMKKSAPGKILINFKVSEKDRAKIQANADRHTHGKISAFIRLVSTVNWTERTIRRLKQRCSVATQKKATKK